MKLIRGTLVIIPVLNVFGFLNFSRDLPDGKDINRSFPGSMNGSLASRMARVLTKMILPIVDFGIDFHTGGGSRYNYPQIRYTRSDEEAKKLADQFAAPFTIANTMIPKSLRKAAYEMKTPMIVFEGGEALRNDPISIDIGLQGIKRVLKAHNMIEEEVKPIGPRVIMNRTSWVRAANAGLFQSDKISGDVIKTDDVMGSISDPFGKSILPVLSPKDGYIIGHNNTPIVNQGDALFHIGYSLNEEL